MTFVSDMVVLLQLLGARVAPMDWPRDAAQELPGQEQRALLRIERPRDAADELTAWSSRGAVRRVFQCGEADLSVPLGERTTAYFGWPRNITTGCPRKPVKLERCGMRLAFLSGKKPRENFLDGGCGRGFCQGTLPIPTCKKWQTKKGLVSQRREPARQNANFLPSDVMHF